MNLSNGSITQREWQWLEKLRANYSHLQYLSIAVQETLKTWRKQPCSTWSKDRYLKLCNARVSYGLLGPCLNRISLEMGEVQMRCHSWPQPTKIPLRLTSGHTGQSHQDGAESCGSSLSPRAERTSCHSGNRCQAATTGQPPGCPGSGWEGGRYTPGVCPASSAGSTWWWCSPGTETWKRQPGSRVGT